MTAERLDRALKAAGIPIIGVSIGSETDRVTWAIQYAPQATAQHRTDGEALRLSFDPASQAASDAEKADRAARADGDALIQAVAQLDFEERQKLTVKAGQTLLTAAQCRARLKAIVQSLL
jgi:hypothetical protein